MAQVITLAGEKLFATKAQANQQLDIDTFIFANVAGQDPAAAIDRNEGIPTSAIVHQQNVQQTGRINDNVVVYSTVLDSVTGPFEFNWVGLYSSVNQTLVAISHVPTVSKTITAPGSAGNTLNRNFGIEYSGIADLAGISVSPETWQLDFSARLSGMDELTRNLAKDLTGKDSFIDDGFKVVPRSTANTFSVLPGVGYVNGLRVELEQEHILTIQTYPQFVYVDAYFEGDASSAWRAQHSITMSLSELADYTDENGINHFVVKVATINELKKIEDHRVSFTGKQDGVIRSFANINDAIKSVNIKEGDYLYINDIEGRYGNIWRAYKKGEEATGKYCVDHEQLPLQLKLDNKQANFDFIKKSIVFGPEQFEHDFDAGYSVIVAFSEPDYPNYLPGKQDHRYLIGGYDNLIEAEQPTELNGRACGHIATHHSNITGQSNHTVCVGGSYLDANDAWYSFMAGGTGNKILPRTSIGYSAYNFVTGTKNIVQGNSNAVFGSDNILEDEVNGSLAAGAANNIKATFSAAFGSSNTVNGRNSFVAGNGNFVGEYSAVFGNVNNGGESVGSFISGQSNTNKASYSRTSGRGAIVTSSHDHIDIISHTIAGKRSFTARLPLKSETDYLNKTNNLESILGSKAVLQVLGNAVLQYEVMIFAVSDGFSSTASFKVSGFSVKEAAGVIQHKKVNVEEIYNTDSGEINVSVLPNTSANLQFKVDQGLVQENVKWTALLSVLYREF